MSEEEKKAIKGLKHTAENPESKFWIGTQGMENIKIVLNLIEKQQKEIEKYEQQMDLEFVEKNFIEKNKVVSKDKIREKISNIRKKVLERYDSKLSVDKRIYKRNIQVAMLDTLSRELLEEN